MKAMHDHACFSDRIAAKRLIPGFQGRLFESLAIAYFTAIVAFLGVSFGQDFVPTATDYYDHPETRDYLSSCTAWDGLWYCSIVDSGYRYSSSGKSNIAFFPAYPLLGAGVKVLLGCRTELALLVVSNACMAGCIVLLREYVHLRFPLQGAALHRCIVSLFAFFPTTFFFRMAYTESLFVLTCLGVFYGIERKWNIHWIALIAGLGTGTRSVGIALLIPLLIYLWSQERAVLSFAWKAMYLAPLAIWGLLAFMVYQWRAFDDPLAFMAAQSGWEFRRPASFPARVLELITFKPVWGVYFGAEPHLHWGYCPPTFSALFNLCFWNPVYWLLALSCIGIGYWRQQLTKSEAAFSLLVLLIPYCLIAPKAGMQSSARYAAVAFPAYLVMGTWLSAMPDWCKQIVLGVSLLLLFVSSALFSRWYWYF